MVTFENGLCHMTRTFLDLLSHQPQALSLLPHEFVSCCIFLESGRLHVLFVSAYASFSTIRQKYPECKNG